MEEKYLIGLMRHLENIAANQKALAENQEKLAMALEQVAQNQSKLLLAVLSMMKSLEASQSSADSLDKIFKDLEKLRS